MNCEHPEQYRVTTCVSIWIVSPANPRRLSRCNLREYMNCEKSFSKHHMAGEADKRAATVLKTDWAVKGLGCKSSAGRQICERDVIGKRCRFKICCRKVCGFESHRSYQPLLFVVRSGGVVVVVGRERGNSVQKISDKGHWAEPMGWW